MGEGEDRVRVSAADGTRRRRLSERDGDSLAAALNKVLATEDGTRLDPERCAGLCLLVMEKGHIRSIRIMKDGSARIEFA